MIAPEYVLARPIYFYFLKWKYQYIYLGHSAGKQIFTEKVKGVVLETKLKTKEHCTLMAKKARGIQGWIRQRTASRSREMVLLLRGCSALVRPHLESCVQLWAPQYREAWPHGMSPIKGHKDDKAFL